MIVALDLATRKTGWCCGAGDVRPTTGVFVYEHVGDDLGFLADLFEKDLSALADRFGAPAAVIYEAPILLPSDKLLPLRKTYGMGMQLELWGRRRGVPVREVSAKAIKKRLTGDSFAKKDQVVAIVRGKLGITLPEGKSAEDAADAFGAWLAGGIDHYARQHQPRWDALLYGGRGGLL